MIFACSVAAKTVFSPLTDKMKKFCQLKFSFRKREDTGETEASKAEREREGEEDERILYIKMCCVKENKIYTSVTNI